MSGLSQSDPQVPRKARGLRNSVLVRGSKMASNSLTSLQYKTAKLGKSSSTPKATISEAHLLQLRQLYTDAVTDEAHKKASRSPTVPNVLEYFWALGEGEDMRKREMAKLDHNANGQLLEIYNESRKTLTENLAQVMAWMEQCRTSPRVRTYGELFYDTMTSNSHEIWKDYLTEDKMRAARQLICFLLTSNHLKAMDNHKEVTTKALLLLQYFETFRVDPHSCLIGLHVSEKIINLLMHRRPASPFEVAAPEEFGVSSREMFDKIYEWSESESSPEAIVQQVKAYATTIRGIRNLKTGDLVMYRSAPDEFRYGRFVKASAETHIVTLNPTAKGDELDVVEKDVWPLSQSVLDFIMKQPPAKYEAELIVSPFEALFTERMQYIASLEGKLMGKIGLSEELLEKAKLNQCNIFDSVVLSEAIGNLQQYMPPPAPLLIEVDEQLSSIRKRHFNVWNEAEVFQPTRGRDMASLDREGSNALLTMVVRTLMVNLEMAVENINMQKRELRDGTRKDNMASWWLEEIRKRVIDKLKLHNFDTEAIPTNYTEIKPLNIQQVCRNMEILEMALDKEADLLQMAPLTKELCDSIYAHVDAFVVDATFSILDLFGLAITEEEVCNYTPKKLKKVIAENDALNKEKSGWVKELLLDIEYLLKMKKLESASLEKRRKNFHVVPVSSLVQSVICRMENEHRTVIELWSPVAYVRRIAQTERPTLLRAISLHDSNAIDNILKNHPEEVFNRDEQGWTPLHLAASTEDRLLICQQLLNSSVVVDVCNNDGNTPLHYLARCQAIDRSALKCQLIEQMIMQGADVNAVNDKGETPLYGACFIGDQRAAGLLLENEADPNIKSKDGATCLHNAVQYWRVELVKLLLQHGADSTVKYQDETAFDLAYKFHFPNIMKVLIEHGNTKLSHSRSSPGKKRTKTVVKNNNKPAKTKLRKMSSISTYDFASSRK